MKRKMPYLATLGLTLVFWASAALNVFADVIWEPSDDFYAENLQECEYEGRDYQTNGKEGFVVIYEEPSSSGEVARIKNGKRLYVGFTYEDNKGNVWAAVNLWGYEPEEDEMLKSGERDGWTLMKSLVRLYGEDDFRKDHEKEFADYQGELDGYEIGEQMIFWEYPGSDKVNGWLENFFDDKAKPVYQYLYTDQDGIRWTYVGYYYGERGWVCVDDPESRELSLSYGPVAVEQELYPAGDTEGEVITMPEGSGSMDIKIAAAAVILVVIVTAVLISVLFKRKGE